MRRAGKRGEGRWEQVSWDEVLDALATRIRRAIVEGRHNELMVHIGRPGEDGFLLANAVAPILMVEADRAAKAFANMLATVVAELPA